MYGYVSLHVYVSEYIQQTATTAKVEANEARSAFSESVVFVMLSGSDVFKLS